MIHVIVDSLITVLRTTLDLTTLVGLVVGGLIYWLFYIVIDRRLSFSARLIVLGLVQDQLTSDKAPVARIRKSMWRRYRRVETKEMKEAVLRPVDENERRAAMWWLSQIKDRKTLEFLERISKDESIPVESQKVAKAARQENAEMVTFDK